MDFVAPSRPQPRSKLGRIVLATAVFILAFACIAFVLERIGVPAGWMVGAALVATLCLYAAIALGTGTTRPSAFFLADRMLSASTTGLASAAACLAPFGIALSGWMYGLGSQGGVIALGIVGGFVLAATLFVPFLRRSGAYTMPEFLAARFGRLTRTLSVPVIFAICFMLLVAQFQLAASVAGLFGLSPIVATWGVLAVLLLCTVPGGMRGAAATSLAQFVILLVGLVSPLAILYAARFGTLSPAAIGDALSETAARVRVAEGAADAGASAAAGSFSLFHSAVIAISLALATASLPPFVTPYLAAKSGGTARRAVTIGLAAMIVVLLAAAGWAAALKLSVLEELVALPLASLGDPTGGTLVDLGRTGAVQVCGVAPSSSQAVAEACSRLAGHGDAVRSADIAFKADGLLAAASALLQLSGTANALLAAALLATLLAALSALLVAASSAISYDLLNRTLLPHATWSARLALGRLAMIGIGCAAAYVALDPRSELVPLVTIALNLAAGVLFPVMAVGIWWKRAAGWSALAGMAAGLTVCVSFLAFELGNDFAADGVVALGQIFSPASEAIVWPGLLAGLSGLIGALVNSLVIVIVSLSTRASPSDRQAYTEGLRHPQALPLLHPEEGRFSA